MRILARELFGRILAVFVGLVDLVGHCQDPPSN
jgi:hypothetical protein